MWSGYLGMDGYKRRVVVVINVRCLYSWCLFCVGAYYPNLLLVVIDAQFLKV